MVPDQRFELRLLGSEPRFLPLEDSGMAPQVGVAPTYLRLTAGFTTIDDTVERKWRKRDDSNVQELSLR